MRKLPIYFLIDVSKSMEGEPLDAVKNGIADLVAELKTDPQALETVHISIILFSEYARQALPLRELMDFRMPELRANGTTALGHALTVLRDCVATEVVTGSFVRKGDYKPMAIIFTDGRSTDILERGLNAIQHTKLGNVVACAAGAAADVKELHRITPNVVKLNSVDSEGIAAFFKWVSTSIAVSSQRINSGNGEVIPIHELPVPPALIQLSK
jgi:uncharacterized protein YegL